MIQKNIYELKKILKEQTLRILEMLEICERAYKSGKTEELPKIKDLEKKVDITDLELEKRALYILALQTPHAKTLREVLMIRSINTDLERIGDLCDNNRVILTKLLEIESVKFKDELVQMLEKTKKMYMDASKSFFEEDGDLAKKVCKEDDVVDELKDEILRKIIEEQVEVSRALLINNFSKNIERIADLATNIAESSIFVEEGKEVRHWVE